MKINFVCRPALAVKPSVSPGFIVAQPDLSPGAATLGGRGQRLSGVDFPRWLRREKQPFGHSGATGPECPEPGKCPSSAHGAKQPDGHGSPEAMRTLAQAALTTSSPERPSLSVLAHQTISSSIRLAKSSR